MARPIEADAQAQSFVEAVIGGNESALNAAVEWIRENMLPGDVYDGAVLEEWAKAAGFTRPEE